MPGGQNTDAPGTRQPLNNSAPASTIAPDVAQRSAPPILDRRSVPNLLTGLRLVLATVFVVLLSFYRHGQSPEFVPLLAAVLFAVAAGTDALDGILARRWDAISVFGRVMDPFADKILVMGAFIVLAGPGFSAAGVALPGTSVAVTDSHAAHVSGVSPWMAVVILARELLVTSLRGMVEARGESFAATFTGKLKMVVQSVGAPLILLLVWMHAVDPNGNDWAVGANRLAAWAVVLVTVWSTVPYTTRAVRIIKSASPRGGGGT